MSKQLGLIANYEKLNKLSNIVQEQIVAVLMEKAGGIYVRHMKTSYLPG